MNGNFRKFWKNDNSPILESDRNELRELQQSLGLSDEVIATIEKRTLETQGLVADSTDSVFRGLPKPSQFQQFVTLWLRSSSQDQDCSGGAQTTTGHQAEVFTQTSESLASEPQISPPPDSDEITAPIAVAAIAADPQTTPSDSFPQFNLIWRHFQDTRDRLLAHLHPLPPQAVKSTAMAGAIATVSSIGLLAYHQLLDPSKSSTVLEPILLTAIAPNFQPILSSVFLAEAELLAKKYQLRAAIDLLGQIPEHDPAYPRAKQLLNQWTTEILNIADKDYQAANPDALNRAKAILQTILQDNPRRKDAQALIWSYTTQWDADKTLIGAIKDARKQGNWELTLDKAVQIKHAYWKRQADSDIEWANRQKQEYQSWLATQRQRSISSTGSTQSESHNPPSYSSPSYSSPRPNPPSYSQPFRTQWRRGEPTTSGEG
ncbi:tetratricopeptide repeat protein [Leptothermofonsia sichuanensis E412]|uniref:hypothetical protein n=1 Tax=Leptothermofonsia sichuanensis TaxID=2917832 RepID=UPI001CA692AB|nr:hypothetical protein [Leptothermofonsia sichuanensis]QZZ21610.1 tetratricopeptide repeat protein [Leptothermofonsia sichuanensis E412]